MLIQIQNEFITRRLIQAKKRNQRYMGFVVLLEGVRREGVMWHVG